MRPARRNLLLGGALLLLVAANVALDLGREEPRVPRSLFPRLSPARAARLRVEGPAGELVLERVEGSWVVATAGGFPAEEARVRDALRRLGGVTDADLATEEPSAAASFGLAPGEFPRVAVLDERGRVLAELDQGEDQDRGSWVRPTGEDRIYRAAALETFEVDPRRWFEPDLVDLAGEPVTGLAWSSAAGRGEIRRDDRGRWMAEGRMQAPGRPVDALLQTLQSLTVEAVGPRSEGVADFELRLFGPDGGELEALSFTLGEGAATATASRFDGRFEVVVDRARVARVLEVLRELGG